MSSVNSMEMKENQTINDQTRTINVKIIVIYCLAKSIILSFNIYLVIKKKETTFYFNYVTLCNDVFCCKQGVF